MTTPMIAQPYRGPLPFRYKMSGIIGLAIALIVIRLPFWVWISCVKFSRCVCRRSASVAHGLMLLEGVRWAGRFWPGRFACLESSLGASFAGIFFLSTPTWCYGSQFRPMQHHAWLEIEGFPLGQAVDPTREWRYQALIRI